jgi:hypothetical protein
MREGECACESDFVCVLVCVRPNPKPLTRNPGALSCTCVRVSVLCLVTGSCVCVRVSARVSRVCSYLRASVVRERVGGYVLERVGGYVLYSLNPKH